MARVYCWESVTYHEILKKKVRVIALGNHYVSPSNCSWLTTDSNHQRLQLTNYNNFCIHTLSTAGASVLGIFCNRSHEDTTWNLGKWRKNVNVICKENCLNNQADGTLFLRKGWVDVEGLIRNSWSVSTRVTYGCIYGYLIYIVFSYKWHILEQGVKHQSSK